jgi:transcriptional regulator with XRE-family HTH domain
MTMAMQPTRFQTRVRAELDAQRLSMRGLARRIDPDNVERARRNLIRWMYGETRPSRLSRIDVARALGIDPSELEGDGDEEADPVVDLVNAIKALVRAELQAAAAEGRRAA